MSGEITFLLNQNERQYDMIVLYTAPYQLHTWVLLHTQVLRLWGHHKSRIIWICNLDYEYFTLKLKAINVPLKKDN